MQPELQQKQEALKKHIFRVDDYPFAILNREVFNIQKDIEKLRFFLSLKPVAMVAGKAVKLEISELPNILLVDGGIDILKKHKII